MNLFPKYLPIKTSRDKLPLMEKEMATHSSILACRIPWTEEPGGLYSPWGCKELDMTEHIQHTHCFLEP